MKSSAAYRSIFCSMQVSACSETGAPVRRARSGTARATATAATPPASRSSEADAVGRDLEVPATWRETLIPPCGVAARAHALERSATTARACRKYSPIRRLDALLRLPALAAEHLGHLLLQLVRQHVRRRGRLSRCRIERTRCRKSSASSSCRAARSSSRVGTARLRASRMWRAARCPAGRPARFLMSGSSW